MIRKLRFWARARNAGGKLVQALRKVGPMVDKVKQELGIAGV